jgi:phosphoribosylanthranilate isomerase
MVKVKICGITSWADAKRSYEAGASFLGFNFYRKSPRYISPVAAGRIIKRLPKSVTAVGVFVNETEENILATARIAGLHQIQLHGDESPETAESVQRSFPVIRAVRVGKQLDLGRLNKFPNADALLFDGFDRKQRGGTGKTFDWGGLRGVNLKKRIFLAGGLTPKNVSEAILVAQPYAVDVCSGVESRPGKKDAGRIDAFMRAAKTPTKSGAGSHAKRIGRAKAGKKT